jgi:hypothetical protein
LHAVSNPLLHTAKRINLNVVVASAICYCYLTVLPEINFWVPRC